MKNLLILSLVVAFLAISACTKKVDIEAEKAEIKSVLDQWDQAYETEDMELLSKIFAHDDDMVHFGTVARNVGWESSKERHQKDFDSLEDMDVSVRDQVIKVHDSGRVAWFSEILDWNFVVQGQSVSKKGGRLTGVLEKRNGNWVIVQYHVSVPEAG